MSYYLHFYVDGLNYSVTLTELVHPMHRMYLAEFDDEYENIFYSDPHTGKWIEQDLGFTPLADMICRKLDKIGVPTRTVSRNVIWHHQYDMGRWLHFGYHPVFYNDVLTYEIYATNHRYMFSLVRKADDWQVLQAPGSGWDFKDGYAERILYVIGQLCQNSI